MLLAMQVGSALTEKRRSCVSAPASERLAHHNPRDASRAPSAMAASFAHTMSGSTAA
jgi:hypothetical protein